MDDWPRPTTPLRCYWNRAIEPDRHPLILDGLAVTFYLVFKEPVLLVHPPSASQPSSGEPFKLTNPPISCQPLISGLPEILEPLVARRDIHAHVAFDPGRASRHQPCPIARHGAWRILELEGRDARRLLSTWAAVRPPLRARHLAASLTNIRPRDGRVNKESTRTSRPPQVTEAQGVDAQLPASSVVDRGDGRAGFADEAPVRVGSGPVRDIGKYTYQLANHDSNWA